MNLELKFDKRRLRAKACPCGRNNKDGKFVPFIGYQDKGYCHSCGETFFPTNYKEINKEYICKKQGKVRLKGKEELRPYSSVSAEFVQSSMGNYENNDFVSFLNNIFNIPDVERVVNLYRLGTSNKIKGSVIFWYIDKNEIVRSGKIMKYNRNTGKRIKEGADKVAWVHKLANLPNFKLQLCLFGEHLLKEELIKPVALVESEKSAIIGSLCMPQYVWLATGGIGMFKEELLNALYGRIVIAFPDLGAFEVWANVLNNLTTSLKITLSMYLENQANANEQEAKLDIADFLLKEWQNECNI